MRRILAALLLLAIVPSLDRAAAAPGRSAVRAAALKTFADQLRGYALRYPGTWKLTAGINLPNDGSPDAKLGTVALLLDAVVLNTGFVVITRFGAHPEHFAEQASGMLHVNTTWVGPIVRGSRTIGGVAFRSASAEARDTKGRLAFGTILRGVHGLCTYNIVIVRGLGLSSTPRLKAESNAILKSFTFLPVPEGTPAAG